MTHAASLSAAILAPSVISDERFFEATELLSHRFYRRSEFGDLRSDPEAPQLLFDWLAHAASRVPDLRVWNLTCLINAFFDPHFGLHLPQEWPWDTRDRLLRSTAHLRAGVEWQSAIERALEAPDQVAIEALSCCAAESIGVDPYPAIWCYLVEHPDNGLVWHVIQSFITWSRLPAYLALARQGLLRGRHQFAAESGDSSGQGPEWGESVSHRGLWHIWHEVLDLLREFPAEGVDLVEGALCSTDMGVRIDAIDVLSCWSVEGHVPPDTISLVRDLARDEEHPVVLLRLEWLLQHA